MKIKNEKNNKEREIKENKLRRIIKYTNIIMCVIVFVLIANVFINKNIISSITFSIFLTAIEINIYKLSENFRELYYKHKNKYKNAYLEKNEFDTDKLVTTRVRNYISGDLQLKLLEKKDEKYLMEFIDVDSEKVYKNTRPYHITFIPRLIDNIEELEIEDVEKCILQYNI